AIAGDLQMLADYLKTAADRPNAEPPAFARPDMAALAKQLAAQLRNLRAKAVEAAASNAPAAKAAEAAPAPAPATAPEPLFQEMEILDLDSLDDLDDTLLLDDSGFLDSSFQEA